MIIVCEALFCVLFNESIKWRIAIESKFINNMMR